MKNIHIHKRQGGKFMHSLENVPDELTGFEFKKLYEEQHRFYPERQSWRIGSETGIKLEDDQPIGKQFKGYEHGTNDVSLYFKDLGPQVSWRLVFVLEYLGPLIIFPIFYYLPHWVYGDGSVVSRCNTQKVGLLLLVGHFIKREVESLFVHRFSNATMPISRIPVNCIHYWMLCGVGVGYYFFHPRYQAPFESCSCVRTVCVTTMIVAEVCNLMTHITLRNLRARGTRERGLPTGWGFDYVSCANYFWETLCWVSFSIMAGTFTSWIFTIISFSQMTQWALKKHRTYRKEFDKYPKNRRAIIPFLL